MQPNALRRSFVRSLAAGSLLYTVPGLFAEELTRTPHQTLGPFYPDKLPLDTDNDLIVVNDGVTPGVGTIAWVSGRILDARGEPVKHSTVEIWQCDGNAVYLHSKSPNPGKRDGNFQGFGRFATGSNGEYLFRTIKPVPYPGRTPHIHFRVKKGGKDLLVTQLYIQGHPLNEKDGVFKALTDPKQRASITKPFDAIPGSKIGEVAAKLDIVLGVTPEAT